jgi:hypothetical protein
VKISLDKKYILVIINFKKKQTNKQTKENEFTVSEKCSVFMKVLNVVRHIIC